MIEEMVIQYLAAALNIDVFGQLPGNREGEYLIVEKTGGSSVNHIRSAVLAIQSYAGSIFLAAQLNERVRSAMLRITELREIADCQLNSEYNFTNPTTKQPRYQAVYDLHYY